MSRENVELVRRSFEAFSGGSIDAVISGGFWSPEIVFDPSPTGIPGLGLYRGYEEVGSFSRMTGSRHSRLRNGNSRSTS